MRKYQSTEKTDVLSPEQHKVMEAELHKLDKTSARDLTPQQKEEVISKVAKA